MTRTLEDVLGVALHTNGGSLVCARNIHEELGFAFTDIAADRENQALIVTGTGDTFCNRFDPDPGRYFLLRGGGCSISSVVEVPQRPTKPAPYSTCARRGSGLLSRPG